MEKIEPLRQVKSAFPPGFPQLVFAMTQKTVRFAAMSLDRKPMTPGEPLNPPSDTGRAFLLTGIGSGPGQTPDYLLTLNTTSFHECGYIIDDELLAAQIVNKPGLVENFFTFVVNIMKYSQGANYVRSDRQICATDFLLGREPLFIIH